MKACPAEWPCVRESGGRGMREEAETERERRRRMRKEGDQKNPFRGGIFIERDNTPP